jgi:hypothetical protein
MTQEFPSGCNSGLQGMRVARDKLGAKQILLCGFDMHGTHYFGKHPSALRNTDEARRKHFHKQFSMWRNREIVINCTPGSALQTFRTGVLEEVLP